MRRAPELLLAQCRHRHVQLTCCCASLLLMLGTNTSQPNTSQPTSTHQSSHLLPCNLLPRQWPGLLLLPLLLLLRQHGASCCSGSFGSKRQLLSLRGLLQAAPQHGLGAAFAGQLGSQGSQRVCRLLGDGLQRQLALLLPSRLASGSGSAQLLLPVWLLLGGWAAPSLSLSLSWPCLLRRLSDWLAHQAGGGSTAGAVRVDTDLFSWTYSRPCRTMQSS